MSRETKSIGDRIESAGCGLALAAVWLAVAAALCIRIIRWGLS